MCALLSLVPRAIDRIFFRASLPIIASLDLAEDLILAIWKDADA